MHSKLLMTKTGFNFGRQNVCDELSYLSDNIFISLARKIVGNRLHTDCAPLVEDLFLFCYDTQADIIEAFT